MNEKRLSFMNQERGAVRMSFSLVARITEVVRITSLSRFTPWTPILI